MKNKSSFRSGFFNPRVLVGLSICFLGVLLAMFSFATPAPTAATLSTSNRSITYTDSTGSAPNPSGVALGVPNCTAPNSCSTFLLTIDSSIATAVSGYDPSQYQIFLQWKWAVPTVDYDVFIVGPSPATTVVAKNQSTADPSTIILPATTAAGTYKVILALSTGAPIPYDGSIALQPKPQVAGICPPGDPTCAPPRYRSYPAGPGQADNAGEPALGVDWNPNVAGLKDTTSPIFTTGVKLKNTGGVAFFTSGSNEWRVNFDDCPSPAVYNWEDVSAAFDQTFVLSDPGGFVDHYSSLELGRTYPPLRTPGRVFAIDLVGGQGNSLGAYSDTDGNSYLPGGTGGPGAGPDHETIGGGPYAGTPPANASYPASPAPGAKRNAVYYCSQNIAAEAQCSRSDDGGQTFGPAVPIFTPSQCTGGIHGHVKVAPDGTVYVPNSSCGTTGTTGAAVSIDNGLTWIERNVTDSTSTQDPSVGIGQNNVGKPGAQTTNTVYLGYTDGDGHAKVVHSGDRGVNWSTPVDVGAAFGVTHAVFPVVVAGDDNRAAFAFVGTGDGIATTGTCNPYGAVLNCKNIWHMYVATTYNGGASWITIDATPDDPVQQGTVCLEGTTCAGGRNLLDFNDFAIDSQGRGLIGYADGCPNCTNTFTAQSADSHGTVTRQSGGRRLFAFFDPVEPALPAAPQLVSAVTTSSGALITWLEPDNGGSPITAYNVYRSTTSGAETFLAQVSGNTTTKYLDPAPPSGSAFYYVRAVNLGGEGNHCGELGLTLAGPVETPCIVPGITILTDQAGDIITPIGQTSNPGWDLRKLSIAEPYAFAPDKLVFTLKVESFPGGVPPANTRWPIQFLVNGGLTTGYWVDMSTYPSDGGSPAAPVFKYGTFNPTGGTGGVYAAPNTRVGAADPSSNFTPDGNITIVVPRSAVGNPAVGANLAGFLIRVRFGSDAAAVTPDNMPDSLAPSGTYAVVGNDPFCRINIAPTALLTATPMSGAPPLVVHFSGAGSTDPDTAPPADTIASYTFNFGDGSPTVTQSTPTIDHTYNAQGEYPARLTVTDSRGKASTNVAQVVISVATNTPPIADLKANPTSGPAPLNVTFDGSGSTDPDFNDTITIYSFRFGDGTPDVQQGSPVVNHSYGSGGTYTARLVVTDSRGATSTNNAQQVITVTQPAPSPTATATATATASPTATATATASPTATATATASPTPTATATASPTPTATATATATASPSASATATATATATPTATATATPTASPTATPINVQLVNIAGRVFAQTGDKVGIAGFIISGSGTKRIMARAIGPSLSVNGKLQDPYLEIHDSSGSPPLTNDNWRDTQEAEIQQTGLAPTDNRESAIVKRLPAGNYTAIIRAVDNSPGIGVIQLYDLGTSDPGELGNLSVRGQVGTDDNALFDGLILQGGTPKRIVFRALGPSVPVTGALQDPTLDVYDANGVLRGSNDNWKNGANAAEIQAAGLAPTDDRESAVLLTLPAGNYTSIVRGVARTTGIGLAEAYKLN